MVKFVFSLFFFFFLPSLSYFFIYYFSLNTRTLVTSHKFPFSFSFLFSLLNFPHHIFTHPLPITHFTPMPSLFLFPSIFLFSMYRSLIHWVCSFFLYFSQSSSFPNTRSRSRAQVCCWVSLFLLKVSLGFVTYFCWVCWEMKKSGCSMFYLRVFNFLIKSVHCSKST